LTGTRARRSKTSGAEPGRARSRPTLDNHMVRAYIGNHMVVGYERGEQSRAREETSQRWTRMRTCMNSGI
jgi:hypothetical protein